MSILLAMLRQAAPSQRTRTTADAADTEGPTLPERPSVTVFEQLYRDHFKAVWRVLRRLGVDPAQLDDAVHDVFLVFHDKWAHFDQSRSARAWILGIAVRIAAQYRRKDSRLDRTTQSTDLPSSRQDPAAELELSESVALLHRLLSGLNEDQRATFVLIELEQFRAPEVAELLRVSENTIYSRLRLARNKFQEALKRHQLLEKKGRSE